MKPRLLILSVAFVCVAQVSGLAQQEPEGPKPYVAMPRVKMLPVIAYQPDCPLQFEKVLVLVRLEDGGGGPSFQLRNRSAKPIRDVTFVVWNTDGGGSTGDWSGKATRQLVMPGQLVPLSEGDKKEIVPLTKELSEKLNLDGPMKLVVVFMILHVEFEDGTTYSDERTFKSLEKYLNGLAGFKD